MESTAFWLQLTTLNANKSQLVIKNIFVINMKIVELNMLGFLRIARATPVHMAHTTTDAIIRIYIIKMLQNVILLGEQRWAWVAVLPLATIAQHSSSIHLGALSLRIAFTFRRVFVLVKSFIEFFSSFYFEMCADKREENRDNGTTNWSVYLTSRAHILRWCISQKSRRRGIFKAIITEKPPTRTGAMEFEIDAMNVWMTIEEEEIK